MSGSILQLAKRDAKHFVTSGGFEESLIISTPDRSIVLPMTGYATKHWINYDTDGQPMNSKNVHVCIDEAFMNFSGYVTRNTKGEVSLKGHLVSYPDSTGIIKSYSVKESFPDETLGLIVLILQDYKAI